MHLSCKILNPTVFCFVLFEKCLKGYSSVPGGEGGPQRYFLFALVSSAIADAEAAEGCRLFLASVPYDTCVS